MFVMSGIDLQKSVIDELREIADSLHIRIGIPVINIKINL